MQILPGEMMQLEPYVLGWHGLVVLAVSMHRLMFPWLYLAVLIYVISQRRRLPLLLGRGARPKVNITAFLSETDGIVSFHREAGGEDFGSLYVLFLLSSGRASPNTDWLRDHLCKPQA